MTSSVLTCSLHSDMMASAISCIGCSFAFSAVLLLAHQATCCMCCLVSGAPLHRSPFTRRSVLACCMLHVLPCFLGYVCTHCLYQKKFCEGVLHVAQTKPSAVNLKHFSLRYNSMIHHKQRRAGQPAHTRTSGRIESLQD